MSEQQCFASLSGSEHNNDDDDNNNNNNNNLAIRHFDFSFFNPGNLY